MPSKLKEKPMWCGYLCALVSFTAGPLAYAADTPASTVELQEITVTAQRREQSILDVPVAVTALGAQTLQEFGIQSFADYALQVPSLSYGYGGGAGGGSYGFSNTRETVIRGVTGANTTSLYIDDTPVPNVLDPRVLDLQRIEVLRGPQGTLFGASAMGGTVRLITQQPKANELSGQATLQGFDVKEGGAGYDFSGSANIPLIEDQLAMRVGAFYNSTPGYIKKGFGIPTNPPLTFPAGTQRAGTQDGVGAEHEYGGIASVQFQPAALPNLRTTLTLIAQNAAMDGIAGVDNFGGANFSDLAQHRPLDLADGFRDNWQFYGLSAHYDTGIGAVIASASYFKQHAFDFQDGSEWVAYCQVAFASAGFCPAVGYWPSPTAQQTYVGQSTGEVRFESALPGPLNFVGGAFYQDQSVKRPLVQLTPGIDAASGGLYGTDLFFQNVSRNRNKQYAGFADLTYKPGAAWELSAGVRKAHFDVTSSADSSGYFGTGLSPPTTETDAPMTKRFVATYKFNEKNMIYASVADGFRTGGQNSVLSGPCGAELAALGLPVGKPVPYTSDTLWNYELGAKNAWADNRISTRAAAYFIDWSKIQQSLTLPVCGISLTANSGAAQIKGAELETDLRLLEGLSLNLGVGYIDGAITKARTVPDGTIVGFHVGDPLSGVPKWTGSVRADYSVRTAWGRGFVRASYTYAGSSVDFNYGRPGLLRPAYGLVDLRTGIDRDEWTATVFVKNLTDKRGSLGDVLDIVGIIPGIEQVVVTQPRTIGLEIQRRF